VKRLRFQVADAVATHGLWSPGQRVGVAVSGGVDSMALLHLLARTQGLHGGRLHVLTVDHGTRSTSAADADFVEAQAAALALPCQRFSLALGETATEAACRAARYAALLGWGGEVVALAHHLDDQLETSLMAWLRGSGPRGLAAMRWREGQKVRPLLQVGKQTLIDWMAKHALGHREDPTNQHLDRERNRLRHQVLAPLLAARPGAQRAMGRSIEAAREDDEALGWWARELASEPVSRWAGHPVAVRRRVLQCLDPTLSRGQMDRILRWLGSPDEPLEVAGGRWTVFGGFLATEKGNRR